MDTYCSHDCDSRVSDEAILDARVVGLELEVRGIKNQGYSEISMKYGRRDNTGFFDGDVEHWIGGMDETEMLFPVNKFVTQLEV